jgi:hypothetical protein
MFHLRPNFARKTSSPRLLSVNQFIDKNSSRSVLFTDQSHFVTKTTSRSPSFHQSDFAKETSPKRLRHVDFSLRLRHEHRQANTLTTVVASPDYVSIAALFSCTWTSYPTMIYPLISPESWKLIIECKSSQDHLSYSSTWVFRLV